MKNEQSGYTIPELLVTMLVTAFFVELIMVFTFGYWKYGLTQEADLDTLTTRLNAGDVLRENIGQSSGLINQNSIPDSNTLNPDLAFPSNEYWETLHAIPGNKPVGTSGTTPLLYFKRFAQDSSGAFLMNGTQPFEDEYVLYTNGATKQLLLRSLANSASNNRLKSSCPPANATPSCPADKLVADDLNSVDVRYFSRAGNLIDFTSIYDSTINQYIGPDFATAEVIEFSLNLTKKPVFQKTETVINSTIIRIALRNT